MVSVTVSGMYHAPCHEAIPSAPAKGISGRSATPEYCHKRIRAKLGHTLLLRSADFEDL